MIGKRKSKRLLFFFLTEKKAEEKSELLQLLSRACLVDIWLCIGRTCKFDGQKWMTKADDYTFRIVNYPYEETRSCPDSWSPRRTMMILRQKKLIWRRKCSFIHLFVICWTIGIWTKAVLEGVSNWTPGRRTKQNLSVSSNIYFTISNWIPSFIQLISKISPFLPAIFKKSVNLFCLSFLPRLQFRFQQVFVWP